MVKNLILFFCLLLGGSVHAQVNVTVRWHNVNRDNNSDSIFYGADRRLTWSDFKGRPDFGSPAAAITESGFGYRMSMNSLSNRTSITITVFCYFNKKKSWVKRGMNTNYALLHEQHHFDITYLNTILFVQKLKEARFNLGNYQLLMDNIYDECFTALEKMQNDYDGETSNGRLQPVQANWNKKIDQLLNNPSINSR